MPLKSLPVGFVKLHRFHAAAEATRLQFAAPIGQTWRGEGGNPELKAAIAYRLAVCWNVLEGLPTKALLDGVLLEMCMAIDAGDIDRARAALARWDRETDNSDGRPNDCPQCNDLELPLNPNTLFDDEDAA